MSGTSTRLHPGQSLALAPTTTAVRVQLGRDEPQHRPSVLARLSAVLEIVTGIGNADLDGPDLRPFAVVHRTAAEQPEVVGLHRLLSTNGAVRTEERPPPGGVPSLSFVVEFARLPPDATHVVFLMASLTGHDFRRVRNSYCSISDHDAGDELGRIDLPGPAEHNARVVAGLVRTHDRAWRLDALDHWHQSMGLAGVLSASRSAITETERGA